MSLPPSPIDNNNENPDQSNTQSSSDIVSKYSSSIWATADVLRGVGAKASDWPSHMMPFFALMLLESRMIRARKQVLEDFGGVFDPTDSTDQKDFKNTYLGKMGTSNPSWHNDLIFYGQNLEHIIAGGPSGFEQRLLSYLGGFDDFVKKILGVDPSKEDKAYLNIAGTIKYLKGKGGDHLYHYCQLWSMIDLSDYNSSAITTLEEHIKRMWSDISASTAGEHFTPADLIELVTDLAVSHFTQFPLNTNRLRIYDPTCGGGNMLFGVEDALRKQDNKGLLLNKNNERYSIQTYGQELNDHLYALAKVESWFRPDANIQEGNTLTEDKFDGELFDLIVANPPYGTDWKQIKSDIDKDETGRFPPDCRPSTADGQHLFLQHIQHHLADDGLALVFCSGSTLFSGDAGGGESNARSKYILTDDGVLGIIQLPKNEFFNTGINTYLWIFKKSKPQSMKGKMFLFNAESLFSKLRKSLGSKNSEITRYNRKKIVKLISSAIDPNSNYYSQLLEENAALTADITNRLKSPVAAGWTNKNGNIQVGKSDGDKFNRDMEEFNKVIPKVISLKDATEQEPALLRLFNVEDLHYTKVSLELTKSNEDGSLNKVIKIDPQYLKFDDLRLKNGLSKDEACKILSIAENEGGVLSKLSSINQKILNLIETSKQISFEDNESNLFCWEVGERNLYKNNLALGQSSFKIRVSYKKRGDIEGVNIQITLSPDIEKDTEITPFKLDEQAQREAVDNFLGRWVKDKYKILKEQVGCEINFNRLFPKIEERKTLSQIKQELADLDAQIAALHKGEM